MVVNFDIFHYFWDFVRPSIGPTTGSTIGPSVGPSISLIAQVNKWRGVTILLRTGGQRHPTSIHTPCPPPTTNSLTEKTSKTLVIQFFDSWVTDQLTDRPTDKASDRIPCPQLKYVTTEISSLTVIDFHAVFSRSSPRYHPAAVCVFQNVLAGTGITTNPLESFHGKLGLQLSNKPTLFDWIEFLKEDIRRVASVVAQVTIVMIYIVFINTVICRSEEQSK